MLEVDMQRNINISLKAEEHSGLVRAILASQQRQEDNFKTVRRDLKKRNHIYWKKQEKKLSEFFSNQQDGIIQCFQQQEKNSKEILACLEQIQDSLKEVVQAINKNFTPENKFLRIQKQSLQSGNKSNEMNKNTSKLTGNII
jgi:uncharacterized protein YdiU (UPF0061 family)